LSSGEAAQVLGISAANFRMRLSSARRSLAAAGRGGKRLVTFEGEPPVQVGAYEGRVGTWTSYADPSDAASQQSALYVELPLGGGQCRDLAVSSYHLSEDALVSLVANGLSVAVSSPAAGNPGES
jgi:hypothetical protein